MKPLETRIAALTEEMLDAAQSGEWARAAELGGLRRELLEAFFDPQAADLSDDPAGAAGLIREVLRSDRNLATLAEQARGRVSDALSEHRRGRRAVGAYREAASADT